MELVLQSERGWKHLLWERECLRLDRAVRNEASVRRAPARIVSEAMACRRTHSARPGDDTAHGLLKADQSRLVQRADDDRREEPIDFLIDDVEGQALLRPFAPGGAATVFIGPLPGIE